MCVCVCDFMFHASVITDTPHFRMGQNSKIGSAYEIYI